MLESIFRIVLSASTKFSLPPASTRNRRITAKTPSKLAWLKEEASLAAANVAAEVLPAAAAAA
jgi:hypothetical protein